MDESTRLFELNISGKLFQVAEDVLVRLPHSKLGKLAVEYTNDVTETRTPLFFNRPSTAFEEILAYYQTGELHMPSHVCPKAFKRELEFWELDPDDMQYCCRYRYLAFFDEFETTSAFQASMEMATVVTTGNMSPFGKCRARIWSVIDYEESTVISKVVMWFLVFCIVVSIFNLSLGTVDTFKSRIDLTTLKSHLKDLKDQDGDDYGDIISLLEASECDNDWECMVDEFDDQMDEAEFNNDTYLYVDNMPVTFDDIRSIIDKFKKLPEIKQRHRSMVYIDIVLLAVFMLEFVVRVCTCPSLPRYFLKPLNDVDIIIQATAIADLVIENYSAKHRFDDKGINVLYYFQMFRVLRILRYVNKVPSVRVLGYTLKTNFTDLVVLLLYVLVGVVIFANFAYFAEDTGTFQNMPESWWWGVITMTTVGYGDVVPKTALGKIVGCVCAMCGVLSLALTVPLFVNTFMSLYQVSHIHDRYLKTNTNQVSPAPDKVTSDGTTPVISTIDMKYTSQDKVI